MRVLGTICARGGSRGIKNKNLKTLLGEPLISYSIKALKAWGKADRIICSTDSEEIQKIARVYGAETPFLRPSELATDSADKHSVLTHALKFCEHEENIKYDFLVDLDPTSPLRTVKDIDLSFKSLINSSADLIFSVYKAHKNPYFNMVELDENGFAYLCKKPKTTIVARQKAPVVYSMNASIYIYRRDSLIKTSNIFSGQNSIIYEMSDITNDIDRKIDFDFIEYILKNELIKLDY